VVTPPSGPLSGVTSDGIDAWLGVPFAKPPIGNLRFRAPQPMPRWSVVRDASTPGPGCLMPGSGNTVSFGGDEDCLYLNVFAPSNRSPGKKLPVMVNIHGGSNVFGAAYADADAFVPRGVIVVTVDYRLGVLGFAGHPALTAEAGTPSGDYGLLDQLQALRWVHDNISAFGGDPGNVTLFGFSAGSYDVVALVSSPLSQGLLAKAAIQGEHFEALYALPISEAETLGTEVAKHVGCNAARDVPACLRAASALDLVNGTRQNYLPPRYGGQVLPRPPLDLLAEQRKHVPLLIGFGREEDLAFNGLDRVDEITAGQFDARARHLVGDTWAPRLEPLHPYTDYDSYKWAYVTMETDAARGCPTRRIANLVSADAPVYRFLFTHGYASGVLAPLRAIHGVDEDFLWWSRYFPDYVPTTGGQLLSARMAAYWTNFAKASNPNGAGLPAWPQYRTPDERSIVLDDPIGTINRYHVDQCAVIDQVPQVFPPPPER
jgi:para-nitrobenzyl esterase